jgi:hypothetical protein
MPTLAHHLVLNRCPHCAISNPNLPLKHNMDTTGSNGANKRVWAIYECGSCGGLVTASSYAWDDEILEYYPKSKYVKDDVPERPKAYLQQALESLHAPSGAVMLAASAVDSMLKNKGYTEGNLYTRINDSAKDNTITEDMARWAHDVRLDANDQRHADEAASLPSQDDAEKVIDFALALAEILFVLPSRVQRGLNKVDSKG